MPQKQQKKGKRIQKKILLKPIGLVMLFGVLLLTALFGAQIFKSYNSQNTQELSVATWGDGTDAFYRQVIRSTGEWEEQTSPAIFENREVQSISKTETERILAKANESASQILGLHTAADGSEKWIEVDLSDKKLYAREGNRLIYEFLVSTGRPGYETPAGEYRVWRKVRFQRYKGGTPGTSGYYNLPNVPFSLFFGGSGIPNWKGYAIHGAYWHNDFGITNRSSGCVNVKPEEAGLLYAWAGPAMPDGVNALNTTAENPGIRIVVHE